MIWRSRCGPEGNCCVRWSSTHCGPRMPIFDAGSPAARATYSCDPRAVEHVSQRVRARGERAVRLAPGPAVSEGRRLPDYHLGGRSSVRERLHLDRRRKDPDCRKSRCRRHSSDDHPRRVQPRWLAQRGEQSVVGVVRESASSPGTDPGGDAVRTMHVLARTETPRGRKSPVIGYITAVGRPLLSPAR